MPVSPNGDMLTVSRPVTGMNAYMDVSVTPVGMEVLSLMRPGYPWASAFARSIALGGSCPRKSKLKSAIKSRSSPEASGPEPGTTPPAIIAPKPITAVSVGATGAVQASAHSTSPEASGPEPGATPPAHVDPAPIPDLPAVPAPAPMERGYPIGVWRGRLRLGQEGWEQGSDESEKAA